MPRAIEFFIALFLIITLSPIYCLLFLVVFLDTKEWPIFVQRRVGYRECVFMIYKFKSMRTMYRNDGSLMEDHERVTKVGRFIRSFSLDELPQLFNVLLGSMSFVGPRPLPEAYLPLYSATQRRRHRVKPGVTGLAQIRGRNSLDWATKFEFDIEYVQSRTWWLDIKIILATLGYVLKRSGVNQNHLITMPPFDGTN